MSVPPPPVTGEMRHAYAPESSRILGFLLQSLTDMAKIRRHTFPAGLVPSCLTCSHFPCGGVYNTLRAFSSGANIWRHCTCPKQLRNWADMILIAPLSANTLAKLANGICDNLVVRKTALTLGAWLLVFGSVVGFAGWTSDAGHACC